MVLKNLKGSCRVAALGAVFLSGVVATAFAADIPWIYDTSQRAAETTSSGASAVMSVVVAPHDDGAAAFANMDTRVCDSEASEPARVNRGGAYNEWTSVQRSAFRIDISRTEGTKPNFGFRVCAPAYAIQ